MMFHRNLWQGTHGAAHRKNVDTPYPLDRAVDPKGGITIDRAQLEIVDGLAGTGHGQVAEDQQHEH
jgi:hypothetical protein